jgi:hypothetical protein
VEFVEQDSRVASTASVVVVTRGIVGCTVHCNEDFDIGTFHLGTSEVVEGNLDGSLVIEIVD